MKTILSATILSAALVLGFGGLAGAQGEKADPVGTWKCEYEIGEMKRTSTSSGWGGHPFSMPNSMASGRS